MTRGGALGDRLERKSIPEPNSGCLLWFGAINSDGYAHIKWNGRVESAHRLVWRERYGEIPAGKVVLHRCDVRCCLNVNHLRIGTQLDNIADMNAKGRHAAGPQPKIQGERHGNRRLTDDAVRQIRVDKRPETKIAEEYGISRSVVGGVRRRETWRHVGDA